MSISALRKLLSSSPSSSASSSSHASISTLASHSGTRRDRVALFGRAASFLSTGTSATTTVQNSHHDIATLLRCLVTSLSPSTPPSSPLSATCSHLQSWAPSPTPCSAHLTVTSDSCPLSSHPTILAAPCGPWASPSLPPLLLQRSDMLAQWAPVCLHPALLYLHPSNLLLLP
jgi:hypothetical protein